MIVIRLPGLRRRRPRRRATRTRRLGRARLLLGLGVPLIVVVAGVLLWMDVAVTQRFDGRLWTLPARVYSDVLEVAAGDLLPPQRLADRLDRCGYARTDGTPRRPGQYRIAVEHVDVFLRAFDTPAGRGLARTVRVDYRGDRIARIRDEDGRRLDRAVLEPELLATIHGRRLEERDPLPLDQMPQRVVDAVLAAEDVRYFRHHGVDLRGVVRAALVNTRHGRIVQGGSTITQQTVKNLFFDEGRTWWRKLREIPMSLILDARYSKRRILEVYLNEVYLGQRGPVAICGVQAAARFYFGRDVADLGLGEAAILAGMIKSPGRFNPFAHPDRAIERRDAVLEAMVRAKSIGDDEARRARAEPLSLGSGSGGFTEAPYLVDFVRRQLESGYDSRRLREEGLRIYTSIDTRVQLHAAEALRQGLMRLEADRPALARRDGGERLEGAMVVLRPSDGALLAMVGGRDYGETQFNRAVQARRQPGSCFKPFVFAAAFEAEAQGLPGGLTPATRLDDEPLRLVSGGKPWSPSNYDHEFRGEVTARQALEESLNVPTVRAAQAVGMASVIDAARRCGIRSPMDAVPAAALGTEEVAPLELAEAYATIARGGVHRPTWVVRAVTDAAGEVLASREPRSDQALTRQAAYLVDDLLRGVVRRGTARSAAALGWHGDAAGKTGTTDDTRDAWFVGYDDEVLALVWVGYDDNAKTGLTGASGALPIWVDFMGRRARRPDGLGEPPPAGIVVVRIDPTTGMLAGPNCPETIEQPFARGSEPTQRCTEHEGRFRRWLRRVFGRGRSE